MVMESLTTSTSLRLIRFSSPSRFPIQYLIDMGERSVM